MRIVILSDGVYPFVIGGMQKHSYNLLKYLTIQGHKVSLFHCVPKGSKLPEQFSIELENESIEIEQKVFHFPSLDSMPGHYVRESYKLSQVYRQALLDLNVEVDLIYAQGFMAWALFKEGRGPIKAPIIVNFHGLEMFQKAANVKMKLEHYLLRPAVNYNLQKAEKVVSLGGKLTGLLQNKVDKDKILVNSIGIGNHWLTESFNINNPRKFAFIGRNERRKGIAELNKAFQALDQVDFELHIIGPFHKKDQLNDSRVHYYGEISEELKIIDLMKEMDVLLVPSWSEGMPTVILEAMATSCAIIASDVGAVNELVNGENGWLCKAGDISSLYTVWQKALNCHELQLESMKRKSYHKVKDNYTWERVIERFLERV